MPLSRCVEYSASRYLRFEKTGFFRNLGAGAGNFLASVVRAYAQKTLRLRGRRFDRICGRTLALVRIRLMRPSLSVDRHRLFDYLVRRALAVARITVGSQEFILYCRDVCALIASATSSICTRWQASLRP